MSGFGSMIYKNLVNGVDEPDIGYYTGLWKSNRREGEGEMKWADGSSFKGIWRSDRRFSGKMKTIDETVNIVLNIDL
jgi:hypothetical protein